MTSHIMQMGLIALGPYNGTVMANDQRDEGRIYKLCLLTMVV